MDYDAVAKAGSMLGSGAVIVMDETRCMVKSLLRLSYFYQHESCGQCTPCREGTGWLWRMVDRIEHGKGRMEDLDLLNSVSDNIQGRTICALGDAAAMPVRRTPISGIPKPPAWAVLARVAEPATRAASKYCRDMPANLSDGARRDQ